jgi:hypothetical protein
MAPRTPSRQLGLGLLAAAVLVGGGVIALELTSDHQDAQIAWAIFGPAIGWSFVATGLYAWRLRPQVAGEVAVGDVEQVAQRDEVDALGLGGSGEDPQPGALVDHRSRRLVGWLMPSAVAPRGT